MSVRMVRVGGFRYRLEDAIRFGLVSAPGEEVVERKARPAPQNKARKPPANKSREVKHGSKASANS